MKSTSFYTITIIIIAGLTNVGCYSVQQINNDVRIESSRSSLLSLQHASKLSATINLRDWKSVEELNKNISPYIYMLKEYESVKVDWHGIGAYRSSEYAYDNGSQIVIHKFAYGSTRSTPHEVWFIYTLKSDDFHLDRITVLGW